MEEAERCCSAGARESSYPATDGEPTETGRWYGPLDTLGREAGGVAEWEREEKKRERERNKKERK